jgi:hypothetical protein
MSRTLIVPAALALCALALAGCLGNSTQPLNPQGLPLAPPALPSLGFAKEVAIDPEHRGGEPSILADHKGNYFVSAPSGVVSTIFNSALDPTLLPGQGPQNRQSFIWKSTDEGQSWTLLALTPPPLPPLRGDAAPGGADTDLAVDDCNTIYFTDLWLGNIALSHTDDEGATWTGVPVTGLLPVLDRNWIAAGKDCGTVYLLYQTFYGQVWVLKSTDKGMTFPQQTLVLDCGADPAGQDTPGLPIAQVEGCYSIDGPIIFDKATGSLYFITGAADSKGFYVFTSDDEGMTWKKAEVPFDGAIALFPVIAGDEAGNLYAVFAASRGGSYNVYLSTSVDQAMTWSAPASVSGPEKEGTELFPWVAAGDAGKVAVVWYGTNETVEKPDDAKGDWFVFMAASDDALSTAPHWAWSKVSEKPNHQGEICTKGLDCTLPQPVGTRGNRNLADFFEVAIDGQGRAITAWADDHDVAAQFISNPMFARQTSGLLFAQPAGNATTYG